MTAKESLIGAYFEHLRARQLAPGTIQSDRYALGHLVRFLGRPKEEERDDVLRAVTGQDLVRFSAHLVGWVNRRGRPCTPATRALIVQACARFYRFLARTGRMLIDVTAALPRPRPPERLPKAVPTQDEMRAILEMPDVKSPIGLRDRAILELLYSTGLRRGELERLSVEDVDLVNRVVRVRQGKGRKDRLVPLGQVAARWVGEYLRRIRPAFQRDGREAGLFLNQYGQRLGYQSLAHVVQRYTRRAQIAKPVSCHSLRHAFATHLLQEGAGVRPIQAMLGHASLQSTQVYTQMVPQDLVRAIERFHPLETGATEAPPPETAPSPGTAGAPPVGPLAKRRPPRRKKTRRVKEPRDENADREKDGEQPPGNP